jgi:hypothetical protein
MSLQRLSAGFSFAGMVLLLASDAWAVTYNVVSNQDLSALSLTALNAGDIVRVYPGAKLTTNCKFTANGTVSNPVIVEGVPAAGQRYVELNLTNCVAGGAGDHIIQFKACNNLVFRNLRLFGARAANFINPGYNGERTLYITGPSTGVTVDNCKIDHNHANGFASGDSNTTQLLIRNTEFGYNGVLGARSAYYHNIYLAPADVTFDGCYIHDQFYAPPGTDTPSETDSGQNLKVRCGKLTIRNSLIVAGFNAALDLVDSTSYANQTFDISGSVIVKATRKANKVFNIIGADGSPKTWTGSFVNCTFIARHGGAVFDGGITGGKASIALYNNAFYSADGLAGSYDGDVTFTGSHNYFGGGIATPTGLSSNKSGGSIGFVDLAGLDFHLTSSSALRTNGLSSLPTGYILPPHQYLAVAGSETRLAVTPVDIGAYAFNPDVDYDGMPDDWERIYFTSLTNMTATSDTDGDRFPDWQEYVAGTLPTNPGSRLVVTGVKSARTNLVLTWQSVSNRQYSIAWRTNLMAGTWSPVVSNIPGVAPVNVRTVSVDKAGSRFYRVQVE